MKTKLSGDPQLLVSYDEHGSFDLGAAFDIGELSLSRISGGLLDGGCGANDLCYDTFNTYCVNTNFCLHDLACPKNGVC